MHWYGHKAKKKCKKSFWKANDKCGFWKNYEKCDKTHRNMKIVTTEERSNYVVSEPKNLLKQSFINKPV